MVYLFVHFYRNVINEKLNNKIKLNSIAIAALIYSNAHKIYFILFYYNKIRYFIMVFRFRLKCMKNRKNVIAWWCVYMCAHLFVHNIRQTITWEFSMQPQSTINISSVRLSTIIRMPHKMSRGIK